MSGGARPGAGRKPVPPMLKKEPCSVKLQLWIIQWMDSQSESRAVLIEDALRKRHKLKPPAQVPSPPGQTPTPIRDINHVHEKMDRDKRSAAP